MESSRDLDDGRPIPHVNRIEKILADLDRRRAEKNRPLFTTQQLVDAVARKVLTTIVVTFGLCFTLAATGQNKIKQPTIENKSPAPPAAEPKLR